MKLLYTALLMCWIVQAQAQNVGIGTNSPSKLLTVNGSILLDQNDQNNATLDSAALRFGTISGVGIASNRTVGSSNQHGLDFYTGNQRRLSISTSGLVGIGTTNPLYRLDITGSLRTTQSITTNSNLNVDGGVSAFGSSYFYSNLYVADYLGIGAIPSASYRLRIAGNALVETNLGVDGNLRADGNATIGGTANISGKLTNEGKAMMLSNSSTTLRAGFTSGTFSIALNAGGSTDITFIIPSFTGNNSNVRVMVAQFVPGTSASNWGGVVLTPHSVDASDAGYGNQSTVKIRFQNTSSSTYNSGTNAVLYLYTVVTH